jgi:acetylglutamate kinase
MEIVQGVCAQVNKDFSSPPSYEKAPGNRSVQHRRQSHSGQTNEQGRRGGHYASSRLHGDPPAVVQGARGQHDPRRGHRSHGVDDNTSYNVNSDTAASKLAVALGAEKLMVLPTGPVF